MSETTAVIEMGSTGIRLMVARQRDSGEVEILDRASRPSRIGRDVFTQGHISREGMREGIAILRSYRELLVGYGITPTQVRAFATSALREATNRDTFVDRIALQTGFVVTVIEDIEENYLMYLAVSHALQDERGRLARSDAMILEVGGGSTQIMLLSGGSMVASHLLSMGTIRQTEHVRALGGFSAYLGQVLEDSVRTACDSLEEELPLAGIGTFIVVGSDARLAASQVAGERKPLYAVLPRKEFSDFAAEASRLEPEDSVARFRIPWAEAEDLATGLGIAKLFLERTGAEEVIVPDVSIRDGLLLSVLRGPNEELAAELGRQILASVVALGRKFHYDEGHAERVTACALALFDNLMQEYGLDRRARTILQVASMLHDIGTIIRSSGHHKHGEYIVANSELFGVSRGDLAIASIIIRYHRKAAPSASHTQYMALPREDRTLVDKLSAILRVADALDRGHDGRVGVPAFEHSVDRLLIHPDTAADVSLERMSLAEKGDLFGEVFGLEPVLV